MKVTLLSHTQFPIETIYCLWQTSRSNEPVKEPMCVKRTPEVDETFLKVLDSGIPVSESISFIFLLEDIPISLREQLVRHRIGVKVDQRIGCDIVPDLSDSSWWSQSMRILDMGSFATDHKYFIPESLEDEAMEPAAKLVYQAAMRDAEHSYNELVAHGIPLEDARNVIPLGATHRISWALNLRALQQIIGKRGCWILQLGLWKPVIQGMVEELATKVDPIFRRLIDPPCFRAGKWDGCKFKLDNERRVAGEDPLPVCSLYRTLERNPKNADPLVLMTPAKRVQYDAMREAYSRLWQRDADTGEKLR